MQKIGHQDHKKTMKKVQKNENKKEIFNKKTTT